MSAPCPSVLVVLVLDLIATVVIVLTGGFLVWLGVVGIVCPKIASGFLLAFATTVAKHHAELAIRMVVGAAFVVRAPTLPGSVVFRVFGWVLIVTTVVMFLMPWRWHQRFAEEHVPKALRFLPLIGVVSLVAGVAVLGVVLLA